jgi:signal transduction histidine kinase/tetratricopeptide (TPR) repeat protein
VNPNKYIFIFLAVIIFSCKEKDIAPRYYSNSKAVQLFKESKKANNDPLKTILLEKALEEIISEEDTIKPFIYDHLIYYNNKLRNYEQSLFYANALIENSSEIQDTAKLALGYYRKAMVQKHLDNQLEVLKNLYKSQNLYLTSKDSLNAGKRLVELGIAQYRLGDFNGSQASQVKALKLLDDHIDSAYAVSIYSNLASSYRQLSDMDEAIDEYKQALKYTTSPKDSLTILNNIANIYSENGNLKKALSVFDLILPKNFGNYLDFRVADNYYFTLWLEDKRDVSANLEEILYKRKSVRDLEGQMSSYDHLIRYYWDIEPEKALDYSFKYFELTKNLKNTSDEKRALKYLIALASSESSREYSMRYIKLTDSIMDVKDHAKNVFAKIKYDEEQKLEQINSLEKLSAQQQIALLKSSNQRNIAIFLGILIIGASGFVIYYIRQKAKKKRIREIHKTEARISKRIHDELANDLYRLMTALENLNAPEKLELLDKLEDIYFRTRDISRENLPVKTNQEYSKEVQDMLSQMTPKSAHIYLIGIQEVNWDKISEEAKITIFRVLQELMVNMKKHSMASIISFNFKTENAKLQINYNDNGVGLQPNTLKKGKGLDNVENRMESIGGSFKFQTGNHGGFSVELIIPF